jgi:UDP-N-acetylmuramate dehydrogenase
MAFSLQPYNSFGIDVQGSFLEKIHSEKDLELILNNSEYKDLPYLILGGGSNVLFTEDFEGLILLNQIKGWNLDQTGEQASLKLGAGENWHHVVERSVAEGWSGLENMALIPGSCGAAPIQNIGAYGVELKDRFESCRVINLNTMELEEFQLEDCQFGYRDSHFKRNLGNYFIYSLTLQLERGVQPNTSYAALQNYLGEKDIENPKSSDVFNAVVHIRQSKLPDPKVLGNAGSFFKNPVISKELFNQIESEYPDIPHYADGDNIKLPAAWLIQSCGWKGKQIGQTGSHAQQALVIVNYGGASGMEIWDHAQRVQDSVFEKFEIRLEPEVRVINGRGELIC